MADKKKISSKKSTRSVSVLSAIKRAKVHCSENEISPEPCDQQNAGLSDCYAAPPNDNPDSIIHFRKPVPLQEVQIRALEPGEQDISGVLQGCFVLRQAGYSAVIALDLEFEQHWWFESQVRSSLSTTVSLSPGEQIRVSIESTQRKYFEQSTLDEVEENDTSESKIFDRDAINITRASSRTKNWNVSGNASVTIPIKKVDLGLNFGGSVSNTVTASAESAVDMVQETTTKSSNNLRTLQKVEVKEISETTEEYSYSRLMKNPYRDRSIDFRVFGLSKKYCVEFNLQSTRPVIIFEVAYIPFTRAFVLANTSFLEQHLVDARLALELQEALEMLTDTAYESALADVRQLTGLALRYLFDEPNIFKLKDTIPGTVDPNDPATSFTTNSPGIDFGDSAFNTALKTKLLQLFTTVNYYYAIYKNEPSLSPDIELSLALSLESTIRPLWFGTENADGVSESMETGRMNEVFRRLSGFLSIMSGSVRPLLHPADEDRERMEQARRAEFVINRVVNHLDCHRIYYVGLYLKHMSLLAGGIAFRDMIEEMLNDASLPSGLQNSWASYFSTEEAFVSGNQIIVPAACAFNEKATNTFLKALGGDDQSIEFGLLGQTKIVVPMDGTHIEPIEGTCELTDVPPPEAPPYLRVSNLNEQELLSHKEYDGE